MIPIRDTIPSRNLPVVTWFLIIANSAVFLFELSLPPDVLERVFHLFGLVPARYTHPQWAVVIGFPVDDYWPFLTSMFLHGGWMHIISNMWTLWIFGDNVEDRMGSLRFLIFYLLCGFAAGLVHWFTHPWSTLPTVGASGAIAGVMGAYFFLFPFARVVVLLPILFFPFFFEVPAVT
jgi:membrane associated rhomboid family serine protease